MHPADKAVLRLAIGLGLAVIVAYGLALQLGFVACVVAVMFLCKPGPPMPFVKGVVAGLVIAGLLVAGISMVPVLEHYALAGVLLTGALLYVVFYSGARKANPLTMIFVVAFTVIPVAGVAEQQMATALAMAFGAGIITAALVSGLAHALFPDRPHAGPGAAALAGASAEAAHRSALQAVVVILPVFVLALTNPALYTAAIMKTVMLGQQARSARARTAGRELLGSTLMGALMATVVWAGLSVRPTLWMLVLWLVAAAFWAGRRLFRVTPTSEPPSFWLNALITMFILLGPGIEDAAAGKDVYAASATRLALFVCVTLYAWSAVWALERWRAFRAPAITSSWPTPPKAQGPACRPPGPGRRP